MILLILCIHCALSLLQSEAAVLSLNNKTIYGGVEFVDKLPGTINNAEKIQVPGNLPGTENLAEKAIPEAVIRKLSMPPRKK
ncbi:hypothetical protein PV328_012369 [Microctonus aethiopoides]|uniref:Uncharacterized protein n=1 Tax=Microctonus aethiopoides TaxID=144406 RepID=A0AA39KPR1_9HYME|nr:hypothetical protein PV328_012369 [Microctonus aethiopoides]